MSEDSDRPTPSEIDAILRDLRRVQRAIVKTRTMLADDPSMQLAMHLQYLQNLYIKVRAELPDFQVVSTTA